MHDSLEILPYRPHPLLRSGHLQTLMVGLVCGRRPRYDARQIPVQLADGESLIVHEELDSTGETPELHAASPLVILIHGLGGDHTSPYLQRLAHALRRDGMRAWRVDLRGSGKGLELAWRPAHAGRSQDLAAIVAKATELVPAADLHVVGFSLSGNIVLKMLGEAGAGQLAPAIELSAIKSAIAVAPPANLHDCANNMDRTSRRLYSYYYLKMLDKQVAVRRVLWPQWDAIQSDPRPRTIREFDAKYTAPLSGFRDANHYYSESSAIHWLPNITTPTTLLIDEHDPIVTSASFEGVRLNEQSTRIVRTAWGGHMGYFGLDANGRGMRWMEHFIQQRLRHAVAER